MTEERTVSGASRENIRQFLDDCVASEPPGKKVSTTAEMQQWLAEQLCEKCPVPTPKGHSQSRLLASLQEAVRLNQSRCVGEVLSDPQTDLEVIQGIKDRYKAQAQKEADKNKQRVYTAIYFAAIARARVSHQQTITQYPNDYLIHSFDVLAGESWVPSRLRELYLEAKDVCERTA